MKDWATIECSLCGGEAEYEREIDPWSAWYGAWVLMSHDCDQGCANHPDTNPAALLKQLEEDEVSRSEQAYERRLADYHGANTPQTPAEWREVEGR